MTLKVQGKKIHLVTLINLTRVSLTDLILALEIIITLLLAIEHLERKLVN